MVPLEQTRTRLRNVATTPDATVTEEHQTIGG